jgi:cytochrome P450
MIFTADPENIKAILATQFNDYGKGERFNNEWHDFLGDGIFSTDGERWHNSRQLIRPQFIKDRISDLNTFEKHVSVLISKLGNGETVDCLSLFYAYTLDTATDFLLGKTVNNLQNPETSFSKAFAEVQRIQNIIARLGPINGYYPRKYFRQQLKIVDEFVNPIIDQALALRPDELEKKTKSDEGYTFLHAIAKHTRDRTALRDQIVNVLLAARDTTACTLSWMFFEISQQPAIVAKLRQEIIDTVGLDRPPTYAQMKNMKYLQHCISETLRLYPSVPYNVRVALKDTTLPRGGGADGNSPIGVLAGEQVGYSVMYMQRRPDIYPTPSASFAPASQYSPERWEHWTPKTWTYLPFNGGPRICVGQQFALTEMAYTVIRILQRFETVESRENGRVPGHRSDIVLSPAGGVKVAFRETALGEKA